MAATYDNTQVHLECGIQTTPQLFWYTNFVIFSNSSHNSSPAVLRNVLKMQNSEG